MNPHRNGSSYNVLHPEGSARAAGLRYVSDAAPGIARRRVGTGFRYRNPNGALVRDKGVVARIKALAIPPAWERVWICPRDDGHVQATGRDARGRKQYEEFTSKDFRTWASTVLAAEALHEFGKEGLSKAIEQVARQLGNTKAVCRKCYIHPAVIDACLDGSLAQAMNGRSAESCVKRLLARRRRQRSLVPLLQQSLRKLRRRGTQLAGATLSMPQRSSP